MVYSGQPAPRQRGATRRIVIIFAVVALLCCGGTVAGGYALFRTVWSATAPVRDSVDTFLGHLEAGEIDAAYQGLCAQVRERYSGDEFRGLVTDRPKPVSHSITGVAVNSTNGTTTGSVHAKIRYAGGGSDRHEFPLLKEGGAWRICGDPY